MATTVTPYWARTFDSASERPTRAAGASVSTMAKSSSSWNQSSIRPPTRWATRCPMSCSGKMTRWAPTRSRMRPSTSLPIPTPALWNPAAPSCRSTPASVVSACTTWVSRSAWSCTRRASVSTPRTSNPSDSSSVASALPKRPSPMTRICRPARERCAGVAASGWKRGRWREGRSANDRPFLGETVGAVLLPEYERREQRDRTDAAQDHQAHGHQLGSRAQQRGGAGGEPHGAQRGDHLEQQVLPPHVADGEQQHRRGDDHADREQRDRQRLPLGRVGDAPPEHDDVRLAACLRPHDET